MTFVCLRESGLSYFMIDPKSANVDRDSFWNILCRNKIHVHYDIRCYLMGMKNNSFYKTLRTKNRVPPVISLRAKHPLPSSKVVVKS